MPLVRNVELPQTIQEGIRKKKLRDQQVEEQQAEQQRFEIEQQQVRIEAEAKQAAALSAFPKRRCAAAVRRLHLMIGRLVGDVGLEPTTR